MRIPYPATLIYIATIVFINVGYSAFPIYHFSAGELSVMDPIAGIVYLCRDFSQRELGHRVFIAMIIGAILSLALADPTIALASVTAFVVGELVDWAVFSFTGKPLAERLLWSASLSAPIDSVIFLVMISHFNSLALRVMILAKCVGILLVWAGWKKIVLHCHSWSAES